MEELSLEWTAIDRFFILSLLSSLIFPRVQWEPAPGLSAVNVLITSRENESPVTKALSPITDVFPLLTIAEIKEKL